MFVAGTEQRSCPCTLSSSDPSDCFACLCPHYDAVLLLRSLYWLMLSLGGVFSLFPSICLTRRRASNRLLKAIGTSMAFTVCSSKPRLSSLSEFSKPWKLSGNRRIPSCHLFVSKLSIVLCSFPTVPSRIFNLFKLNTFPFCIL